jgi:hypothetical protein
MFLQESFMGNKLYVGNLPYSFRDSDLEQTFGQYGAVSSAKVMMERDTGRSKGFGFVEMGSDAEAQAAIQGVHGQNFGGRDLVVNEARPMEPRAPRSGGLRRRRWWWRWRLRWWRQRWWRLRWWRQPQRWRRRWWLRRWWWRPRRLLIQRFCRTCFGRQKKEPSGSFFVARTNKKIVKTACISQKSRIHNARAGVSAGTCTQGLR